MSLYSITAVLVWTRDASNKVAARIVYVSGHYATVGYLYEPNVA